MNLKNQILEVLYKPYSPDIRGYVVRIADFVHIVINSTLSKPDAEDTQAKLESAAEKHPNHNFVLLHGNGQIYKSDNFKLPEMSEAS